MKHSRKTSHRELPVADICLITEGTYPYVTGGVSSWIHSIVKAMPQYTFSLLHISSTQDPDRSFRYQIPDNIISILDVPIHDSIIHENITPNRKDQKQTLRDIHEFHTNLGKSDFGPFENITRYLASPGHLSMNTKNILEKELVWELILTIYKEKKRDASFLDYFWTWRFIHMPVFQIFNAEIPPARIYHTVSTGYGGLLGAVAKLRFGKPLLLSEHGIYTKERHIEIRRSDWIYVDLPVRFQPQRSQGLFKDIWNNFFLALAQITYLYSDRIITLYKGNQDLQLQHGADISKCTIIPNSVNTNIYFPLRKHITKNKVRKVGFVGRVVPIKDVKTLIKACRLVVSDFTKVEFLILGPLDEDPEYVAECKQLVELLELHDHLHFLGRVDVREYYPKLDVNVLTSISEGQPLTILEAMAVGVPSVSSDVGACKDLLYGQEPADSVLGRGGIITNIGKPEETANAILKILRDNSLRQSMIESGYKRVEKYYREELMIQRYLHLYKSYMQQDLLLKKEEWPE